MRRLTYEFVKEQFEKESYTLLSKDYKNNQQKLKCVCPKGHTNDISFANWSNRNSRCPYCYGNIKKTLEEVLMLFEKAGYTLLTRKYENNKQKLACVCQNGHRYSTTLSNWLQGKRCPYCCGQIKPTIKFIRAAFKKEGYILLTNKYINNLQKLNFICSNGHRYKISWANWKKGHRCRICFFYA